MPRRKYGHLRMACPPTPAHKCNVCKMGRPCPVHKPGEFEAAVERKRKKGA